MDGFLNVAKPKGITSYDVIRTLKKALRGAKLGHAGTLDPNATGVLVVGVGRATRFLPFLMALEKEYVAVCRLGVLTDTLDTTGKVTETKPVPENYEEALNEALPRFLGDRTQVPPAFSAARVGGKRLYELARKGTPARGRPKRVRIKSLEIGDVSDERFTLRAIVGKGTYLRVLVSEIAAEIGTVGIIAELARTRVGNFSLEDAHPPDSEDIRTKLIATDSGLAHYPPLFIRDAARSAFLAGNAVGGGACSFPAGKPGAFAEVRVYADAGAFLGMGSFRSGGVSPLRLA